MNEYWTLRSDSAALRTEWAALKFMHAARKLQRVLTDKAGFNPNQPRVPAGNPEGGQWTADGGFSLPRLRYDPARREEGERVQVAGDIAGFTRHGINQAINRGVSPSAILDAVRQPLVVVPQSNGTTRYVGDRAVVVLDPAGGVVTEWPK